MGERILHIDLETYSSADIKNVGNFRYALDSTFEILLFGYAYDDDPVEVVDLMKDTIPVRVVNDLLYNPAVLKVAHNAAFEWFCLAQYYHMTWQERIDWLKQWRCSAVHAAYLGLPRSLSDVGAALGFAEDKAKMGVGKRLIAYFCKPCKPTKRNGGRTRNLPEHDPEKWELFIEYNRQDIVAEREIERRLKNFPVPEFVWQQWRTDMKINARGCRLDRALMEGAIAIDTAERESLLEEARTITGLDNPNSRAQSLDWLHEQGVETETLRKDDLARLLDDPEATGKVRRFLEIKRELGKTSNAKWYAAEEAVCDDDRARGLLQFYGANRTGREAGRILQPQNLPRTYIHGDLLPLAREMVKSHNADGLRWAFGNTADTLSQLIRTLFIASKGRTFVDADFSAIEARLIAWEAKEDWVLEVFRTTGKIYEATASQMFGVPFEKIKKGDPEYSYRQKGKVATLALGYQGGTSALIAMKALEMGIAEEELQDIVDRWRKANPHIVSYWWEIDKALKQVVSGQTSKRTLKNGIEIASETDPDNDLSFLTIKLPSGRKLYYFDPKMSTNRFGSDSISYMGMNQTKHKWERIETYGGKCSENLTQAIGRDCLFEAIERLEAAGYEVVFHIHDEVVIDAPGDKASLDDVVRIMAEKPAWAKDLPLDADGWVNEFFKKD